MAIGFWNDINSARAAKMWAEGESASQIGAQLGCSRNSVIGKIHRMGLASRAANHRIQTAKTVRARRRKHTLQSVNNRRQQSGAEIYATYAAYEAERTRLREEYEALQELPDVEVPAAERRGVQELLDRQCRWPIGDPQHRDFHFCHGEQVPGLPYCKQHCSRAFQPPEVRARADGRRNSELAREAGMRWGSQRLAHVAPADRYAVDIRALDIHDKEPA